MSFRMDKKGLSFVLRCWIGILLFYLCRDVYGVKVLDINILSVSNHSYLFQEERGIITCDFELEGASDHVKSVHWSTRRNGKFVEFYVWKNETRSSRPTGVFNGRIDIRERDPRKLIITSANIEMHGDIKCDVKTIEGSDSSEKMLVVIADTCKESDWKFNFDKETCVESVIFDCKGFYPKPSQSCGLYDRTTQTYINSFPLDIISKRKETFDMSVSRHFKVEDVIEHEDVVLRCDIIVYGVDYKFQTEKEMFGERGCSPDYPSEGIVVNATDINNTCWKRPANGSVIAYQCNNNEQMKTIICVDGNWLDDSDATISDDICGTNGGSLEFRQMQFVFSVLLNAALIFFIW